MIVTVTGLDSKRQQYVFPPSSRLTIGRKEGCDVRLLNGFISDVHLIIEDHDGKFSVQRLGENPSLLNNTEQPIGITTPLTASDRIFVQGYLIQVSHEARPAKDSIRLDREAYNNVLRKLHEAIIERLDPRFQADDVKTLTGRKGVDDIVAAELAKVIFGPAERRHAAREALRDSTLEVCLGGTRSPSAFGTSAQLFLRERYAKAMATAIGVSPDMPTRVAVAQVREHFDRVYEEQSATLTPEVTEYLVRWLLNKEVTDLMFEFGPLTDLLKIPDITEIMVVSKDLIYVEISGLIIDTGKTFLDDSVSLRIIEKILAPINRRVDRSSPMVDARLPDGSRVHAVIPPVAQKGPCITIRRFSGEPIGPEGLIAKGTIDERAAGMLKGCVLCKKNIIISGGTGSGKTTLLNALSSWIPDGERIVTIEDTAELRLQQRHVVSLEGRPKNVEKAGEISIRDLVKNALRMRPDRIVVGECRGAEALDMLQAMNTGHDGSLTTVHANTPEDVIQRLQSMVLQAGDMPADAIRQQIGAAVHVIIQIQRTSTGQRRVSHITELCQTANGGIRLMDIMRRRSDGRLAFTGHLPTFIAELAATGTLDVNKVVG